MQHVTTTLPDPPDDDAWCDGLMSEADKKNAIEKLELAADRMFVGAFAVKNNLLEVKSSIFCDRGAWEYRIKVEWTLNGEDEGFEFTRCVHTINGASELLEELRHEILNRLAAKITHDLVRQNQKTLVNMSKDKF
jgi:hypothetical protein